MGKEGIKLGTFNAINNKSLLETINSKNEKNRPLSERLESAIKPAAEIYAHGPLYNDCMRISDIVKSSCKGNIYSASEKLLKFIEEETGGLDAAAGLRVCEMLWKNEELESKNLKVRNKPEKITGRRIIIKDQPQL